MPESHNPRRTPKKNTASNVINDSVLTAWMLNHCARRTSINYRSSIESISKYASVELGVRITETRLRNILVKDNYDIIRLGNDQLANVRFYKAGIPPSVRKTIADPYPYKRRST